MSTASNTHATGKINVTTYEPRRYEEIYDCRHASPPTP